MATYICSDIHGDYYSWLKLLKKIKFSNADVMYVLGDVIDRGFNGIQIIRDIMQRKNVNLYMGNHELMFLNAAANDFTGDAMNLWMNNKGAYTFEEFLILDKETQDQVLFYLRSLPVVNIGLEIETTVLGKKTMKKYYLAHASFSNICLPYYSEENETSGIYFFDDISSDQKQILWDRSYAKSTKQIPEHIKMFYKEYTLVCGHTPTPMIDLKMNLNKKGRIIHKKNRMYIDCGASYTLGCIRLDDLKEFYIDKK